MTFKTLLRCVWCKTLHATLAAVTVNGKDYLVCRRHIDAYGHITGR